VEKQFQKGANEILSIKKEKEKEIEKLFVEIELIGKSYSNITQLNKNLIQQLKMKEETEANLLQEARNQKF